MSSASTEWAKSFKDTSENPPVAGAILTTLSGLPVKLTAELKQGQSPFVFARAYTSDIYGCSLGWYLRDSDDKSYHGWRAVLLPRARADLIKTIGLGELQANGVESIIFVKSLRLIRYSHSNNSMLCEIHEYCTPEEIPNELPCDTPTDITD